MHSDHQITRSPDHQITRLPDHPITSRRCRAMSSISAIGARPPLPHSSQDLKDLAEVIPVNPRFLCRVFDSATIPVSAVAGFKLPNYQITQLKMKIPLPGPSQDLKDLHKTSQAISILPSAFVFLRVLCGSVFLGVPL
jgi:hypothetical protein